MGFLVPFRAAKKEYPRDAVYPVADPTFKYIDTFPLTQEHKKLMRGEFDNWVNDWIAKLRRGEALPSKKDSKFWMGGQPFWAIDADGKHTHVAGYEILFRHAAVRPDKMHNAPVKTFFTGRADGKGVALFDTLGGPAEHTILEGSPFAGIDTLQSDLVKESDCRLVTVQLEWAKHLLLAAKGQIKFITINVRPDEYVMNCTDEKGRALKDLMIEAAMAVKAVQSEIVFELTEYAAFQEKLFQVLKELRSHGINVWADDVAVKDKQTTAQRKGQHPQGLKPDTHATLTTAVRPLLKDGLISGHKLAGEVCIQLTDKPLQRFPAFNGKSAGDAKTRKAFSTTPELDFQYGPVGAKQDIKTDFEHLQSQTAEYMQSVHKESSDAIFVLENSSETAEIETFTKHTGFVILGEKGHHAKTLIQGGISADLALDLHDIFKLHSLVKRRNSHTESCYTLEEFIQKHEEATGLSDSQQRAEAIWFNNWVEC